MENNSGNIERIDKSQETKKEFKFSKQPRNENNDEKSLDEKKQF